MIIATADTHPEDMLMDKQQPSRLKRLGYPMPDFVRKSLLRHGLMQAYKSRPPYQQNDYIGWVTGAKLKLTGEKRLAQMLDDLSHGDRYMKMVCRAKRLEEKRNTK